MSARGLLIRAMDSEDQEDVDLIGVAMPFTPGTQRNAIPVPYFCELRL